MEVRKPSFLCLSIILACIIPMLILLLIDSDRQAGSTISWFFMEFSTPALILGLALIIYFIHKARAS
jgi:uncharacterized integral membrane protein